MITQTAHRKRVEATTSRLTIHKDEPVSVVSTGYPAAAATAPFPLAQWMENFRQEAEELIAKASAITHQDSVFIKTNNQILCLRFKQIQWIEAYGDYVSFNTDKGRYVVHTTMKAIESKLPVDQFIRVHRSFIVRTDRIDSIDESLIQIDKKLIPIGESYRSDLFAHLNVL